MNHLFKICLILSLFIYTVLYGQYSKEYMMLIKEADSLYKAENYALSSKAYSKAFTKDNNNQNVNDRYNSARSCSLAKEVDSAFAQLFKITNTGKYSNYSHISTDSDLKNLQKDKRWGEILQLVQKNKVLEEKDYDKDLIAILDTVYIEDQKYRQLDQKYQLGSEEEIMKNIKYKDSINLEKVKEIIDNKGWLGASIIGKKGNTTLFLVIQHADSATQHKYLPVMREAVKKGNAQARHLALLEDRVALGLGKKQIYGSQIGVNKEGKAYVLALEDPDNVDRRRAEVGLEKLEDYTSYWGIKWNIEEYKESMEKE